MLKFSGKINIGENYEGMEDLKNEDFVTYDNNRSMMQNYSRNQAAESAYFPNIKRGDVNKSANNLHHRSLDSTQH